MVKKNKTPSFNQETVDQLFGGWILKQKEIVNFSTNQYIIAGLTTSKNDTQVQSEIMVFKYDNTSKKWLNLWKSPSITSDDYTISVIKQFKDIPVGKIHVLQSRDIALVATNIVLGGAHGTGNVLAFTINKNGDVTLEESKSKGIMTVSQDKNSIMVKGESMGDQEKLYLKNGQFKKAQIQATDLPQGNIKAFFILGDGTNSGVLASKDSQLTAKVGDTITFVSNNDETSKALNNNQISIFSDAWNGPPLETIEADRLTNTSYTFDRVGEVHFLLVDDSINSTLEGDVTNESTFTVTVQPK